MKYNFYNGEEFSSEDTNPIIITEGDFTGTIFRFNTVKFSEEGEFLRIIADSEVLKAPIGMTKDSMESDPQWNSTVEAIIRDIIEIA